MLSLEHLALRVVSSSVRAVKKTNVPSHLHKQIMALQRPSRMFGCIVLNKHVTLKSLVHLRDDCLIQVQMYCGNVVSVKHAIASLKIVFFVQDFCSNKVVFFFNVSDLFSWEDILDLINTCVHEEVFLFNVSEREVSSESRFPGESGLSVVHHDFDGSMQHMVLALRYFRSCQFPRYACFRSDVDTPYGILRVSEGSDYCYLLYFIGNF